MRLPAWVKGTSLLAVALAAGIAIGVAWERRRADPHDAVATASHHVMHRLNEELGLDSAQRQAIAAILDRRQGSVDSTWRTIRPRMHATMDSTLQEIVGVLRPDQIPKYQRMVESVHPGNGRAHD